MPSKKSNAGGRTELFKYIETIANVLPIPIYWSDTNNVILGVNELVLKGTGAASYKDFIGKTAYDLYPKEMADKISAHHKKIIRTGQMLSQEEKITDIATGATKYFMAFKAPLRDEENNIVEVIGTSIDITDSKNAKALAIENEKQKNRLQEQEKFRKLINQAAHDVQSPLASLLIIMQSCMGLTRKEVYRTIEKFADIIPVPL